MREHLFIDGTWVSPRKGGTFEVADPATVMSKDEAPWGPTINPASAANSAAEGFRTI